MKLLNDIIIETKNGMKIIRAGTEILEMAVTTGNIAFVPGYEAKKRKKKKDKNEDIIDEDELEENSNSQISPLQLDH